MGFLNQAGSQVVDLFRSMSPASRLTTIALLGVIAVSAAFLFQVQSGESDSHLFGGRVFSDREIDAMSTAFSKADLNDWNTDGNRINVPKSQRHLYLASLADSKALPEKFDGYLEDIISSSNPFQSREQFETQKRYAVQRDLATIVRSMSGIESATVKITEKIQSGLRRSNGVTALVAVRGPGSSQLTMEQVEDIRAMVSRASGAAANDVTVSDLQGRTHTGESNGTSSAFGNAYAQAKRYHENEWRRKIEEVLTFVPGSVVGVDVTLDKVATTLMRGLVHSQPQAVVQEGLTSKVSIQTGSAGGAPGAEANGVANAPISVADSGGNARRTEESSQRERTENALSTEETESQTIGLTPTFVTASILLPKSYIRRVWNDLNPPDPDADPADIKQPNEAEIKQVEDIEIDKIKRLVDRLLPPIDDGSDKWPRIEVTTYLDLPPMEPLMASTSGAAMGWLAGHWQTMAMLAVGLFALLMVRSGLKAAAPGTPALDLELDQANAAAGGEAGSDDEDINVLRLRRGGDAPSLKEELTDLVRDDPDAAASVLSQWIGSAN
jgi:flagellar M-ring protein FliF